MRKTYKEKYLEMKKESEFLLQRCSMLHTDYICEHERFKSLKNEFDNFKLELKKKEERAEKQSFIIFLIGFVVLIVFGFLGVIFSACGLI